MKRHMNNYLLLTIGVVAISFSPLAVKLVTFTPVASAFYRSFYAAVFFLLIALWQLRSGNSAARSGWLWPSVGAGIFLGVDLALWHKTIIYLGAGPATFLGNSQVIFLVPFAALVFRERIPGVFYAFVALVMAGLYMLLPSAVVTVSRLEGYVMGLAVGFTYAGMLICFRYAKMRSKGEYPEIPSLFVCFAVSALTVAAYALFSEPGSLAFWDVRSHVIMALTALLCQTFGWFLINTSILRISAHEGSLLLLMQPVLATAWGAIFFREELGFIQITGIALSIAVIALYQFRFTEQKS